MNLTYPLMVQWLVMPLSHETTRDQSLIVRVKNSNLAKETISLKKKKKKIKTEKEKDN